MGIWRGIGVMWTDIFGSRCFSFFFLNNDCESFLRKCQIYSVDGVDFVSWSDGFLTHSIFIRILSSPSSLQDMSSIRARAEYRTVRYPPPPDF
jgi:hypothetical protein